MIGDLESCNVMSNGLCLAHNQDGRLCRKQAVDEWDRLRLEHEKLKAQLRMAQEVINEHVANQIEGFHCVDCMAEPDQECDCPMLASIFTAMRGYEGRPISRRVCYFAEVNAESKAACTHCRDLTWPTPGWISSKGNYLTSDPHEAKWWETREQAVAFCSQGNVRHLHLYATEHMFVS